MAEFDVNGVQNVEVSVKLPCEKTVIEQLEIMEKYTDTHRSLLGEAKEIREVECLKVLFPTMFRSIQDADVIAGRLDILPIGFGSVTSLGGAGHFCVFGKLRSFQQQLEEKYRPRVDRLYDYWLDHDLKTKFCTKVLTDATIGRFIDCEYPMIATTRLSGMMLDYEKLLSNGICGLCEFVETKIRQEPDNTFYHAALTCFQIYTSSIDGLQERIKNASAPTRERAAQLKRMYDDLEAIRTAPPKTFTQALQMYWLYSMLAGVINYGRLDDFLGPYLSRDLDTGLITEDEAFVYLKCLWTLIEARRTTVNGRIIVGGMGRKHPREADRFLHICMRVAKVCRYVEPQFTLRFTKDTSEEIWDEALDALGAGATYPTLYNDDINVPAVQYGMRVDQKTAEQYVPFGCTEFVIQGQSTGSPNICFNMLKLLTLYMNAGIDPMDGKYKADGIETPALDSFKTFEEFYDGYKKLVNHYLDLAIDAQMESYRIMSNNISNMFTSILINDCLDRGKAVLDGGVRYLGGTNEIYGSINTSDSLVAIKKLVFEQKKYSLGEIHTAMLDNFAHAPLIRKDLLNCPKYGNDIEEADDMANDVYELIAKGTRNRGIAAGMQYFLVVISNNQLNTEWGTRTAASPDGRLSGMYMNPANNPQGGADKSGPTAMLNSLRRFDAKYHAGSVQNIKFSPSMFNEHREVIKALFKTYFANGGCHLMVTVVDRGELEDAVVHPERHKTLIVRVSGFSAVFIDLDPKVQQELLSRNLYDEEKCL